MTRTEDRLADALRVAARDGQEVRLRPLTVPARTRRQWIRWLAPAAAAAAVALVVTTSVLLTGGQRQPSAGRSGPPRFYVVNELTGFVVRATATGRVTDRIPDPAAASRQPVAVAAGGGGREFIIEYARNRSESTRGSQTLLYSFRLTSAGRVTGLHPVAGGAINGSPEDDLTVSPDSSRVAVAVIPCSASCSQAQIVVVNLKTGTHSVYQGGVQRHGYSFDVLSVSWAGNTSLVFLGEWTTFISQRGPYHRYAQVRTLSLTAGGGSLTRGRVLLRNSARYPDIEQAQLGPGGTAVTIEVVLPVDIGSWQQPFQVISVPLGRRGQPSLLYQGHGGVAVLQSDASGRYLLVVSRTRDGNGWIDHGKLRLLPPQAAAALTAGW